MTSTHTPGLLISPIPAALSVCRLQKQCLSAATLLSVLVINSLAEGSLRSLYGVPRPTMNLTNQREYLQELLICTQSPVLSQKSARALQLCKGWTNLMRNAENVCVSLTFGQASNVFSCRSSVCNLLPVILCFMTVHQRKESEIQLLGKKTLRKLYPTWTNPLRNQIPLAFFTSEVKGCFSATPRCFHQYPNSVPMESVGNPSSSLFKCPQGGWEHRPGDFRSWKSKL